MYVWIKSKKVYGLDVAPEFR